MVDYPYGQLYLGLVVGVVALDRADQMLHQDVIHLFGLHRLERQMKLSRDLGQTPVCRPLPFRQKVHQEGADVLLEIRGKPPLRAGGLFLAGPAVRNKKGGVRSNSYTY
jgi:hypothetical protein